MKGIKWLVTKAFSNLYSSTLYSTMSVCVCVSKRLNLCEFPVCIQIPGSCSRVFGGV